MKFTHVTALAFSCLAISLSSCEAKEPKPGPGENKAKNVKVAGKNAELITANMPGKARVSPKKARKLLVFWRCEGFVHQSIAEGNEALKQMADKTQAFSADLADDYSVFTPDNLKQYDVIFFNNTTHLKPNEEQQAAILGFLADGKGIAGAHAAADNFGKWGTGIEMMGGIFNGHPWGAGGTWAFKLDDPTHPVNAAFDGKGFWHKDEIYQYKPETFQGASKMRLLNSLDMSKQDVKDKIKGEDREVAVSWIQEFKGGRIFYSNFGHNRETWTNPVILQHFLDGIQYAAGDLEADATPTATAKISSPALAPDKKEQIK